MVLCAPETAGPATSVFADAEFLTLRLTLDHHAPGSLYTVVDQSEGFIRLHPTCEVDAMKWESAIKRYRTIDVSASIERKLSAGIKVAEEKWGQLDIGADLTDVREIKAIYSNSKVERLSTEVIRSLLESFLARKACLDAVEYELKRGFEVCQTEAVIVSDLVYHVSTDASSNFGLETLIEWFLSLSGKSKSSDSKITVFQGDKMYHAVRLHRSRAGDSCILLNAETARDEAQSSG